MKFAAQRYGSVVLTTTLTARSSAMSFLLDVGFRRPLNPIGVEKCLVIYNDFVKVQGAR